MSFSERLDFDLCKLLLVVNARLTDAGLAAFPTLHFLTLLRPDIPPATLDDLRAARLKLGPFPIFQPSAEVAR